MFFAVTMIFAYTVRPIMSVTNGYFLIYGSQLPFAKKDYLLSELLGVLATAVFLLGYSSGRLRSRGSVARTRPLRPRAAIRLSAVLMLWAGFMVIVFSVLSGGALFMPGRATSLTQSTGGGKYLFGAIALPVIFAPALAVIGSRAASRVARRLVRMASLVFSIVVLSLLYQRGLVLFAVIGYLWAILGGRRIGGKRIAIYGAISFALLLSIRPAINFIIGSARDSQFGGGSVAEVARKQFLFSPIFDFVDVGVRAVQYRYIEPQIRPEGLLAVPYRLLPASERTNIETQSFGNQLNEAYAPGGLARGFGFVVPLWIELFGLFGWVGLVFLLIPGYVSGSLDGKYQRYEGHNFYYLAAILLGGFVGPPDGMFQWAIGSYLAISLIYRVAGSRPRRRHKEFASGVPILAVSSDPRGR